MALTRVSVDGIFDTVAGILVGIVPAGSVATPQMPITRSIVEQRDVGTANFTVLPKVTDLVLAGSGTVQATLDATPYDGQQVFLTLETAYTAVTVVAGAGAAIVGGVALTVTAGSFAHYRYRAANLKWYRIG